MAAAVETKPTERHTAAVPIHEAWQAAEQHKDQKQQLDMAWEGAAEAAS